jgi:hypothetical protein
MTEKRVSRRRPAAAKSKSRTPELSGQAVVTILESAPLPAGAIQIDAAMRRQLIAAEAYFLAERRGFEAGHELDDWIEAESIVDSRLRESRAA